MGFIEKTSFILTGTFLMLFLIFNFLYPSHPRIPGDIYFDKTSIKVYIPVASTIAAALIIGIFLKLT